MGDAARRQKLKEELAGAGLPTAQEIADLIDESNFEKLLEMIVDLDREHGAWVPAMLMKEVSMYHPEQHKRYQASLKESRKQVVEFINRRDVTVQTVESTEVALSSISQNRYRHLIEADYQYLLNEKLEQSHYNYLIKIFIEGLEILKPAVFVKYYQADPVIDEDLPSSWPRLLKAVYHWSQMQEFVRNIFHHWPKDLAYKSKEHIVYQNLAVAFSIHVSHYQRNSTAN